MKELIEAGVKIETQKVSELQGYVEVHEDYAELLKKSGLKYRRTDYYLEVDEPHWEEGWILHVSVIQSQFLKLLDIVLPLLIQEKIPFKIARSSRKVSSILGGELGWLMLGKVLCIYPTDASRAAELATTLIRLTQGFRGPEVLTDRRLGNVVYTQWGKGTKNVVDEDMSLKTSEDIVWPFDHLAPAKAPKRESVLQDRYKPMYMLKEDPKGTVRKGLWLKTFYHIKWCVIKEGRQNMVSDVGGRDIIDRLRWQFELHKALEGIVPLPAVYDLFEENGDGYLVMEYIRGISLHNRIEEYFQERIWSDLPLVIKESILSYIMQVLDIIETMHSKGFIHRDITSNNFLVDRKNRLCMIDLELSYSSLFRKPFPPFRLGTPGYMSPEQEGTFEPKFEQDIYAIGAVLLQCLTGLSSDHFAHEDKLALKEQLSFFIPYSELVDKVGDCFSIKPTDRPSIPALKNAIKLFKEKQKEPDSPSPTSSSNKLISTRDEHIKEHIQRALNGLSSPGMLDHNKLWVSKVSGEDGSNPLVVRPISIHEGFYEGLSGVIYLLSRAHICGFSVECCKESYEKSVTYICQNSIQEAGLYSGTAGMAIAVGSGIQDGIISNQDKLINRVKSWLENKSSQGNGIVKGLAGQGMALLRVAPLLDEQYIKPLLQEKITQLLEQQQEDGSWIALTDRSKKLIKGTGFGHGVAGIVSFLLCYLLRYDNDLEVSRSAHKAIEWLAAQAFKKKGLIRWSLNTATKQSSFDFQDGCMGVMLSLIKGYQVFEEERYHILVEDCLKNYPPQSIIRDLTQVGGLSGWGEVCLEAASIFDGGVWQERADWIAEYLSHYFKQRKDGSRYWVADGSIYPTADLLVGNSGVIHFLLRYFNPGKLAHPLLSS